MMDVFLSVQYCTCTCSGVRESTARKTDIVKGFMAADHVRQNKPMQL